MWKHRKDRNDNSNPDFDYEAWKRKHTAFADEFVPRWVTEVKERYGQPKTKYVCVGLVFACEYHKKSGITVIQLLLWSSICL